MKNLSIEEKAKRYDDALDNAKVVYKTIRKDLKPVIEQVFPELAESDDEKIRKEMLQIAKESKDSFYMILTPNKREALIAWLEKQGEQKLFNYESANIQQKDFTPKVEPKFRKGDIIKHNRVNIICKVILVNSASYYVENIETRAESELFYAEENFHLWTIEDVKDGNVLYSPEHNLLWIYKDKDTYHVATKLNYPYDISIGGDIVIPSDVCPAPKEQCDILFARIKNMVIRGTKLQRN